MTSFPMSFAGVVYAGKANVRTAVYSIIRLLLRTPVLVRRI